MTQSEKIVEDEEELINEIRKRLKNELPSKIYDDKTTLLNFLKARNFDLDQAEIMLRKHLDFRKQMQVDTIVKDFKSPQVLTKYMSQSVIGFDKSGCLIRYCPLGNIDGKGLFKSTNSTNVLKACIQAIQEDVETLKQISEKSGKIYSKCLYIYNMENMTLAKATHKKSIEYYLQGVSNFQDNYPEILKSVHIINASIYFTMVFSLVQRMLAGSIVDKIHVYGQDGWKDVLLQEIDADVLPVFLGGNRTDPDGNPLCNTFIGHAGMIPEKYYLTKNPAKLLEEPGTQVVTVHSNSDVEIPVYVDNPHSTLQWKFECSKNDICFGLRFSQSKESKCEDLIPLIKIETNLEPETGMYRCHRSGTYIFVFSNSYSWFISKQVYYNLKIVNSKDLEN